jgi:hypothetical protein
MSTRGRIALFIAFVVVCVGAGVTYLLVARDRVESQEASLPRSKVAPKGSVQKFLAEPHIVFRDTGGGDAFGKVAVVPAADPGGPRALADMECDRVDVVPTGGICLITNPGIIASYKGVILDGKLRPRFSIELAGVPSRARVSSDGKYASTTVFVAGDSYAPGTFSTRTSIIDMKSGRLVGNLEAFKVTDNGKLVDAVDQNYWGVTFGPDSDTFYATLSTGGEISMIKGSVKAKTAAVIAAGVECPSVSPDGTQVAYKKNLAGTLDEPNWRLHVMDLSSKKDWALAETRSVDDQVEWIDSATIAYGLPAEGSDTQTNVWQVRADGRGKPVKMTVLASSPSVAAAVGGGAST